MNRGLFRLFLRELDFPDLGEFDQMLTKQVDVLGGCLRPAFLVLFEALFSGFGQQFAGFLKLLDLLFSRGDGLLIFLSDLLFFLIGLWGFRMLGFLLSGRELGF